MLISSDMASVTGSREYTRRKTCWIETHFWGPLFSVIYGHGDCFYFSFKSCFWFVTINLFIKANTFTAIEEAKYLSLYKLREWKNSRSAFSTKEHFKSSLWIQVIVGWKQLSLIRLSLLDQFLYIYIFFMWLFSHTLESWNLERWHS